MNKKTNVAEQYVTLPVAIIIGALFLALSIYAVQYSKQKSIEEQHKLELAEDTQQKQKEYIAKRKSDCLEIYKTEDEKWNNVKSWRYNDFSDECLIRYKDLNPKTTAECDEIYPITSDGAGRLDNPFLFLLQNSLCNNGEFETSF